MNNNFQFSSHKNYIQSLRAFSVLIVFLYHLNFEIFSKGYLGVDIFFVISGYVISQRIYKDFALYKKILVKNFFIRRFKRIFPLLFIFILIILFFFIIFGPVTHLTSNLYTSFFSIFGISNLYFLSKKTNYFDTVFDDPLGHTWSLGVEEQFYFVYPFILYAIFSIYKKNWEKKIILIFFTVSILCIISSFYFSRHAPEIVFYFPFFRFWEFLAGCIVFFVSIKQKINKNFYSIIFFILIVILLFINFSKDETFYILTNLVIVILVCLLILFYNSNSANKIIFENKILIFIGNISFSLYLWHLPVIYFLELYFGNSLKNFLSFPISVILSTLTYYFIENKYRYYNFKKISNSTVVILFVPIFISLLFLAFINNYNNNLKIFIKEIVYKINYLENKFNFNNRTNFLNTNINNKKIYSYCTSESQIYSTNNLNLRKECLKIDDNNLLFFIEGNSHTANFINMFDKSHFINNFYYSHKAIQGGTYHNRSFKKVNSLSKHFKKVIYTTNIDTEFQLNSLKSNIYKFDKNVLILILGPIPNVTNKINLPSKCMIREINCYIDTTKDKKERSLIKLEKSLKELALRKNIFYFSPYKTICPTKRCLIYNKKKDILKLIDNTHLSMEGSLILIPEFKKFYKNKFSQL